MGKLLKDVRAPEMTKNVSVVWAMEARNSNGRIFGIL